MSSSQIPGQRNVLSFKSEVAVLNLSCLSWNSYIKSYLLSSDYEGIVALWDTSYGSCIVKLDEHEKRAWSVDFSLLNPTQMASGGDDSKGIDD